ncbi:MAG: ABC transporter substrate-binding protein [Candidatus Tectomicrobia bacterium]|uniref:ABC transporter substrate-binding protein n=1 Tax=Tectimicrobiota bacterium TaxID=2528274 RepID=A0A932GPW9_UNCTE|nr:ABC transporter substrate-binding protein [Candidatus Tectomicrobia bacterium]
MFTFCRTLSHRALLQLAVLGFCSLSLVSGASAADKLTVAWTAVAGSQAPLWVTKDAGLFEKNGIDAFLIYIDGGSKAAQAMLAGDVPLAEVGGNATVVARLKGADILLIMGLTNKLAYSLIVSPQIKRPEDLRGKKLTVSRFGSNSDYATRKILLKWGLQPDKDVAIIQIPGGQPTRLGALQAGQVAGLVAQPPVTAIARKTGYPILAGPEDFGTDYPTTPVAALGSFTKEKPDVVRRFVKAMVEGIHTYKTKKEFSIQVISKYMRVKDQEALEDSYAFFAPLVPEKPYPTVKGVAEALEELGAKDPKARSARPEDFVDMRFVKELDESGFVDQLYRGRR